MDVFLPWPVYGVSVADPAFWTLDPDPLVFGSGSALVPWIDLAISSGDSEAWAGVFLSRTVYRVSVADPAF